MTALGLVFIVEGLLPLLAPAAWRRAFMQLLQLHDGQIRFFGLLALLAGLLLLTVAT
ncbi:DUF2065 domain-containing protein [Ottowia sp.]|uniref:DUF2065 domain-containing protein n=1 Tax=Ottowia sp. TaxID=1898956 RepID=UPI00396488D1